jgi:hypothetical protein
MATFRSSKSVKDASIAAAIAVAIECSVEHAVESTVQSEAEMHSGESPWMVTSRIRMIQTRSGFQNQSNWGVPS